MGGHIPADLAQTFANMGVRYAIETGTYRASSTRTMAGIFDYVWSIEMDEHWHNRALCLCNDFPNITFRHGDSRAVLPSILEEVGEPVVLWLDAHWCGGARDGQKPEEECPLEDELEAIAASEHKHLILIDDARLFVGRPEYPHDPDLWPTYERVKELLPDGYFTTVHNDIIVSVPKGYKAAVEGWING